jgi:flagellar basal body rod protein FlgC
MNLLGLMDVSSSALEAERVRAEVVASNMANAETTRTADRTSGITWCFRRSTEVLGLRCWGKARACCSPRS